MNSLRRSLIGALRYRRMSLNGSVRILVAQAKRSARHGSRTAASSETSPATASPSQSQPTLRTQDIRSVRRQQAEEGRVEQESSGSPAHTPISTHLRNRL